MLRDIVDAAAAIRDLNAKLAAVEAWTEKWCAGDLPDRAMYELEQIFNRTAADALSVIGVDDTQAKQASPPAAAFTGDCRIDGTMAGTVGYTPPAAAPDPALPGLELARQFHDLYESMAPQFGYETRPETRQFDPESKNGRLMIAVCAEITRRK